MYSKIKKLINEAKKNRDDDRREFLQEILCSARKIVGERGNEECDFVSDEIINLAIEGTRKGLIDILEAIQIVHGTEIYNSVEDKIKLVDSILS